MIRIQMKIAWKLSRIFIDFIALDLVGFVTLI